MAAFTAPAALIFTTRPPLFRKMRQGRLTGIGRRAHVELVHAVPGIDRAVFQGFPDKAPCDIYNSVDLTVSLRDLGKPGLGLGRIQQVDDMTRRDSRLRLTTDTIHADNGSAGRHGR